MSMLPGLLSAACLVAVCLFVCSALVACASLYILILVLTPPPSPSSSSPRPIPHPVVVLRPARLVGPNRPKGLKAPPEPVVYLTPPPSPPPAADRPRRRRVAGRRRRKAHAGTRGVPAAPAADEDSLVRWRREVDRRQLAELSVYTDTSVWLPVWDVDDELSFVQRPTQPYADTLRRLCQPTEDWWYRGWRRAYACDWAHVWDDDDMSFVQAGVQPHEDALRRLKEPAEEWFRRCGGKRVGPSRAEDATRHRVPRSARPPPPPPSLAAELKRAVGYRKSAPRPPKRSFKSRLLLHVVTGRSWSSVAR